MAYQFLTQARGPVIQESLLVDAAAQGAATSKYIPGTASQIVSGLQEGLDAGINTLNNVEILHGNQLNNQIKQSQVDSLPSPEGIAEKQRAADLKARAERLKAEQENVQFEQEARIADSQLDNLETKTKNDSAALQQESDLNDVFATGDSRKIADAVLRGNNLAYFNKNPNAYNSALTQIASNSENSPDDIAAAKDTLLRRRINDEREKNKAQWQKDHIDSRAVLEGDGGMMSASAKLGNKVLSETIGAMDMEPDNKYRVDPNNPDYILRDKSTGNFAVSESYGDPKSNPVAKTYMNFDKNTGKILARGIDSKVYTAYGKYNEAVYKLSGQYANQQYAEGKTKPQPSPATALDQTQSISTTEGYGTSPFSLSLKKSLALPDAVYNQVKDSLDSLQYLSVMPQSDQTTSARDTSIQIVSRSVSDAEFDNSAELQKQFSSDALQVYNYNLQKSFGSSAVTSGSLLSSTKDLYYASVGQGKYSKSIRAAIDNISKVQTRSKGVKVTFDDLRTNKAVY